MPYAIIFFLIDQDHYQSFARRIVVLMLCAVLCCFTLFYAIDCCRIELCYALSYGVLRCSCRVSQPCERLKDFVFCVVILFAMLSCTFESYDLVLHRIVKSCFLVCCSATLSRVMNCPAPFSVIVFLMPNSTVKGMMFCYVVANTVLRNAALRCSTV